jgi:hypothetical protein
VADLLGGHLGLVQLYRMLAGLALPVAFTHQVGDGLHSAIIKATKPVDTSQAKGVTASAGQAALPLASQPGCC